MAYIVEIADLKDPRLAAYVGLTEAQLRSRRHPEEGCFIAESEKVIAHALDAGYQPISLLMERGKLMRSEPLLARCEEIPVYTAERETLAQLTGYALTRGILCAMKRPELPSLSDVCAGKRRIVILENIVDPTNVGAVFRSAAALGMDGVLVTPSCCDPLHRRSVRWSMGTVFQIPWTQMTRGEWPGEALRQMREQGYQIAAMALKEDSLSLGDPQLGTIPQLALVLGTEGDGLNPETIAQCDMTVRIPMAHGVDSLNVAMAGAVAFWELGNGAAYHAPEG